MAKEEADRLRKVAENEGDRLFAAAEEALAAGDVDGARANEKAAAAAYASRKVQDGLVSVGVVWGICAPARRV